MNALTLLENETIVPVVVIEDAGKATMLAQTLLSAGIGAIEITLRTGAALEAIRQIATHVPEIVVGAGSVRRPDQFQEVIDAGARFAVSPGATHEILDAADQTGLPLVPGAVTPSEVLNLLQRGYTLQKFFPAELAGGIPFIRALSAPIPEVSFFPTGGINATLAVEYLALPNVHCIGGSWFVAADLISSGDFETIARLSCEAVEIANGKTS
ncbi:MAG: bifunctional 4-hydroxy-2-oxoglutarate aldolase/2-dehydro-3-deoxy-phosphogluconate aldolase [Pseudomonadales bacterium]|nr:bifunctional 4-hydroxy-2-oxoglutarate aldolase/2-dehydro-3-deoxy-phosphogluconate aldolase [Pseudomonadales bacterium]